MFKRSLTCPHPLRESFFLWGPRQAGKTTLLRQSYPDAIWLDLLMAEEFRRYLQNPELLRSELASGSRTHPVVVIDEVQKVPSLLDEAHWLIENRGVHFVLCGSSARKVKRGHANLLGGRALRRELFGLTAGEIGDRWDLTRMLNHGYLPRMYLDDRPIPLLNAYVADYLKEEIAAEGLVRNLPVYSEFLNIAARSDAELVNFSTIARDCGVSSHTIQGYFQILVDTLLGRWLPAFRTKPKRRVIGAPKFFFSDLGVVNFLAKRGRMEPGSPLYGKAFENWVFHELCAYNAYFARFADLSYWRLASGIEVDFIIDQSVAIEAKAVFKATSDHLRGLRELAVDQRGIARRYLVCLEGKTRETEDGVKILPVKAFADLLWAGEIY